MNYNFIQNYKFVIQNYCIVFKETLLIYKDYVNNKSKNKKVYSLV